MFRVHGGVKESISCVQELMGALRRAQAVFKSLRRAQCVQALRRVQAVSRVHGGVKESTSCVQEFMGALRRAQAVFKSSWGR